MENDMKVQRFDSLPLDATYFTDEGYLVDHPIVTSVGIFVYHNPDGSERRELRLPEEVFAISIHALREEGDSKNRDKISIFKQIIQHSARI